MKKCLIYTRVSDQGQLKEKYKAELSSHAIEFEEGKHTEEKILTGSLVLKSPGIPEKADIIKKVKEAHITIIDEIEFAYRYIGDGKVMAITGTNGKTTTTVLLGEMVKQAGRRAWVGGNVAADEIKQTLITAAEQAEPNDVITSTAPSLSITISRTSSSTNR